MSGDMSFRPLFCYVPKRHLSEISQIGLLGMFIPFRGENTPIAQLMKRKSNATNTGEEIDHCVFSRLWIRKRHLEEIREKIIS